ncbi:MAG: radical SAM family heme chaperone HemW [Candidatus Dormibacteria bacterium]
MLSEPGSGGIGRPAPAPLALCSEIRSLYVHIPFCERKCGYCDFASVVGLEGQGDYVSALRAEVRLMASVFPHVTLDTIFVGGGTPGLLELSLLHSVMDEIRAGFTLAAGAEVTLEANPSSTSEARAEAWRVAGFNRVSLGLQSLEPDVLRFLDRVHDAERAVRAVAEVRAGGFVAINCDLIYAVPGLEDTSWARTLDRVLELDPGHLSCYELTVERGTALHAAVRSGRVADVDEGAAVRQHRIALSRLEAAGYRQYEVSNFARTGRQCRHNLAYWRNQHYLAAGVGAHGHVPAAAAPALGLEPREGATTLRYWHTRSLPAYVRSSIERGLLYSGHEFVEPGEDATERLMLGLRLNEGIDHPPGPEVDRLAELGLITLDAGLIRTTPGGQEVLNDLAVRLTM